MNNTTAKKDSKIGSLPPFPTFLDFYAFLARERKRDKEKTEK